MTRHSSGEVVKVLRAGGSVRICGGYDLAARTYRGYQGRNPMTGALVEVPPKRLPLLQKATGQATDLGIHELEILPGAPVWAGGVTR
jgi:hypothetical protein